MHQDVFDVMYLPTIQLQLQEPITGRYDCTGYVAAMAADAQTHGAFVPTGREVRLASDEPIPDRDSPGLNVNQVDAALFKLSAGAVDLDVHGMGSGFDRVIIAAKLGAWVVLALWRGVLVDAGLVTGFRAGHAVLVGSDDGKPIVADPLVGHWLRTTWPVLEEAARQLIVRNGGGAGATGAYYGLTTRTPAPSRPPTDPIGESVEFIQISQADADALPSLELTKPTPIEDFAGTRWATIGPTHVRVLPGLVDAHTNRRAVVISTGRFYADGDKRPTVQVAVIPK